MGAVCSAGMLFQFGGCDVGSITTSVTLDGRSLLISLVRGAVLMPIDTLVTDAINNAFSNDN